MVSNPDPFEQFGLWFDKAHKTEPDNPNAMTLATADQKGCPSARTVLLKEWGADGFVFYTNLHSRKGQELAQNHMWPCCFTGKVWPVRSASKGAPNRCRMPGRTGISKAARVKARSGRGLRRNHRSCPVVAVNLNRPFNRSRRALKIWRFPVLPIGRVCLCVRMLLNFGKKAHFACTIARSGPLMGQAAGPVKYCILDVPANAAPWPLGEKDTVL